VSIALDGGHPAIVECARLQAVVLHDDDGHHQLPHDAASDVALPELPPMHFTGRFEVDAEGGVVAGLLGGLELLGRAVRGVAELLPGRSVVAADYETTDPETPLGLAGRAGEPLVVLIGDAEYALDC